MKNILPAIIALVLAASASAQECIEKTETFQGKPYKIQTCIARVDDVIKTSADGFVKISYVVQYKGQRLAVDDPLAQYDHAMGEQITFIVGKQEIPADGHPRGFRVLFAFAADPEPKPEAKPAGKQ